MNADPAHHLLVVDDEAPVLRLLERVLERANYRVSTAIDGESALDIGERDTFDAAIIDLTLPGISGGEVARALREREPQLPIVITSGHDESHARAAVDLDDAVYLQKPFTPTVLLETVERALR